MQIKCHYLAAVVAVALLAPACVTSTAHGNKCHGSYKGRCLRANASDYDCRGGSGNGPYYTGLVRVVGPDVFDLDRDGDGIGCDD